MEEYNLPVPPSFKSVAALAMRSLSDQQHSVGKKEVLCESFICSNSLLDILISRSYQSYASLFVC